MKSLHDRQVWQAALYRLGLLNFDVARNFDRHIINLADTKLREDMHICVFIQARSHRSGKLCLTHVESLQLLKNVICHRVNMLLLSYHVVDQLDVAHNGADLRCRGALQHIGHKVRKEVLLLRRGQNGSHERLCLYQMSVKSTKQLRATDQGQV